jgi:rSAM/selenodomain-associated transferase 1
VVNPTLDKPAVLIFAKAPIPGFCKTRMQPAVTPEQCAVLQDALLKDLMVLKKEIEPDVHVWVAYTPTENEAYFRAFSSRVFEQKGKDLGERMRNGLVRLFNKSYQSVTVIGTDTPLHKEDIHLAFAQLKEYPVVIGPAHDGGYYLLGLTQDVPELFSDISWGTCYVFNETMRRVKNLGLQAGLLDRKRDIDDPYDLMAYEKVETNRYLDQWKQDNLNILEREHGKKGSCDGIS